MIRRAFLLAFAWLYAGTTLAGPPNIDRSIRKEPGYQTKSPKYGLLLFGMEGNDRVWLVLDGDTLYVDRNGDGDLTRRARSFAPARAQGVGTLYSS